MKALLVTDSMAMRRIERHILLRLGIKDVLEAGDGREGLEKLKIRGVGLVLTDWNMPKMNGLEFVKTLRAAGNNVPVVMVTRESDKARVIEAFRAGVNGYVVKPFTPKTLVSKIKEVFGRIAAVGAHTRKAAPH